MASAPLETEPRERFTVGPRTFRRIAYVALAALTLIVLTGSAVRLTGSGLGCPDWPRCYGGMIAPLDDMHAWIEYGNRLLSGLVGLAAAAAGLLAWRRRPFRRKLAVIGTLLPIGVLMQAALGAVTVRFHLEPELVMAHYLLSMLLLDASFALAWLATYEPSDRRRSTDRLGVWSVRGLLPLGALTIFVGTLTTASGPHAGGAGTGDVIRRLEFAGPDTLEWVVQRHGALAVLLGLAVIAVIVLLHRPGGDRRAVPALLVAGGLIAAQGAVGLGQWLLDLPAELVWAHIVLAVATWLALLWSVGRAGRLVTVVDPARETPPHPATPPASVEAPAPSLVGSSSPKA